MFWGELRFGEFASTCFELPESCSRELTCTRTMSRELLSQGRLTWRELGHLAWALANLEAAPSQCLHRLNVPHRLCCVVISGSFPYQVWDLDLILAVQQDSERQCLSLSTSGCLCHVKFSVAHQGEVHFSRLRSVSFHAGPSGSRGTKPPCSPSSPQRWGLPSLCVAMCWMLRLWMRKSCLQHCPSSMGHSCCFASMPLQSGKLICAESVA